MWKLQIMPKWMSFKWKYLMSWVHFLVILINIINWLTSIAANSKWNGIKYAYKIDIISKKIDTKEIPRRMQLKLERLSVLISHRSKSKPASYSLSFHHSPISSDFVVLWNPHKCLPKKRKKELFVVVRNGSQNKKEDFHMTTIPLSVIHKGHTKNKENCNLDSLFLLLKEKKKRSFSLFEV